MGVHVMADLSSLQIPFQPQVFRVTYFAKALNVVLPLNASCVHRLYLHIAHDKVLHDLVTQPPNFIYNPAVKLVVNVFKQEAR